MSKRRLLLGSIAVLTVSMLISCIMNPKDGDAGSSSKGGGLHGKLVDVHGKAVIGASVKAFLSSGALKKTAAGPSSDLVDSAKTDNSGAYQFDSLPQGTINLEGDYSKDGLVVLITGIKYNGKGAVLEVKTDTLRPSGQITGRILTHTDNDAGALVYVPGTSYLAITNDTGGFTISGLPQGVYNLSSLKDGFKPIQVVGAEVQSGNKTVLDEKLLEADPAFPPPAPGGLSAIYDTLRGVAAIRWRSVSVSDLDGYLVFRNDSSVADPVKLHPGLLHDTVYYDTLFHDFPDAKEKVLAYRLKAQDKDANTSLVYSKPIILHAPSPAKVRTAIQFTFLKVRGDTASIYDSISIMAKYSNPTRHNLSVSWFENGKDSAAKVSEVSSLSGTDTLTRFWKDPSATKIYFAVKDEAGSVWWDSTTLKVINDKPSVAGLTDTAIGTNDSIRFEIRATDYNGIRRYLWDLDGDGVNEDTTTTNSLSHRFPGTPQQVTVSVTVQDIYGAETKISAGVSVLYTGFVAVGDSIFTSPDGVNWTKQSSAQPYSFTKVTWTGRLFIGLMQSGFTPSIMTSYDGLHWTFRGGTHAASVKWAGNQAVAVGYGGEILTSPDGITWTERLPVVDNYGTQPDYLWDVTSIGNKLIAVGDKGGTYASVIYSSSDGVSWNKGSKSFATFYSVAWTGKQLVAVGDSIWTSLDGVSWNTVQSLTPNSGTKDPGVVGLWRSVIWNGKQAVVVGSDGKMLTSPDGNAWTQRNLGTNESLGSVAVEGDTLVVTGSYHIYTSLDAGQTWTIKVPENTTNIYSVTQGYKHP